MTIIKPFTELLGLTSKQETKKANDFFNQLNDCLVQNQNHIEHTQFLKLDVSDVEFFELLNKIQQDVLSELSHGKFLNGDDNQLKELLNNFIANQELEQEFEQYKLEISYYNDDKASIVFKRRSLEDWISFEITLVRDIVLFDGDTEPVKNVKQGYGFSVLANSRFSALCSFVFSSNINNQSIEQQIVINLE